MARTATPILRRDQLIAATIATVDELGLPGTTIAHIARNAGLSTGIISHYFGDKAGLLHATMRRLLTELGDAVRERREAADDTPREQLRAIVDGNFSPSQTNRASMRVWLAFWASAMHEPSLARLQRINDRRLQSNLCWQFRRRLPEERARVAAAGLAAIIDGLWLRGSLRPGGIDVAWASSVAYDYLDRWLPDPDN